MPIPPDIPLILCVILPGAVGEIIPKISEWGIQARPALMEAAGAVISRVLGSPNSEPIESMKQYKASYFLNGCLC